MMPRQTPCHIVWGGSGGVGRAVVGRLSADGKVVLAYCRRPEELSDLATRYQKLVVRPFVVEESFYRQEAHYLEARHYIVEGMVDCVGSIDIPAQSTLTDRLEAILRPNLYHPYLSVLLFKELFQQHASVVLMSSIRAVTGTDNANIEYAFAKAAVENLTKSLVYTLRDQHVRVNCLRCTPVANTKISRKWQPHITQSLINRSIYNQLVSPADIAATAVFLLSSEAQSITGDIIDLSKGFR